MSLEPTPIYSTPSCPEPFHIVSEMIDLNNPRHCEHLLNLMENYGGGYVGTARTVIVSQEALSVLLGTSRREVVRRRSGSVTIVQNTTSPVLCREKRNRQSFVRFAHLDTTWVVLSQVAKIGPESEVEHCTTMVEAGTDSEFLGWVSGVGRRFDGTGRILINTRTSVSFEIIRILTRLRRILALPLDSGRSDYLKQDKMGHWNQVPGTDLLRRLPEPKYMAVEKASIPPCVLPLTHKLRVAIIVPYRAQEQQKRAEQLVVFLDHMERFMASCRPWVQSCSLFVMEQGDQEYKFNRGKLLNAGVLFAVKGSASLGEREAMVDSSRPLALPSKLRYETKLVFERVESPKAKQPCFDSFILHDVDLLPNEELRWAYCLPPGDSIVHIGAQYKRYGSMPRYLGGVVSMSYDTLVRCNGFPNTFWGWGGEDDALYARLETVGHLDIIRPPAGELRDLEEEFKTERASTPVPKGGRVEWRNMFKREALVFDRDVWIRDGLDSCDYRVVRVDTLGAMCSRILVDLKPQTDGTAVRMRDVGVSFEDSAEHVSPFPCPTASGSKRSRKE